MKKNIARLEAKAKELRKLVLDMCVRAGTGHVTSSMSAVEIMTALYHAGILRYRCKEPRWPGRDRFVLSKGQASPLLYAVLADAGFYPTEKLDKFCARDGMFGVHLQHDVPGVEVTSGSLGHGLGIAAGMALAAKKDGKKHKVYTLLGDGECYEGSIWESAQFAAHNKLDNLVAVVDRNGLCVTDFTEKIVRLGKLERTFAAFGWQAWAVNGHSFRELLGAFGKAARDKSGKPKMIVAYTTKGKGISFMENVPLWHGCAPSGAEAERARKELCR